MELKVDRPLAGYYVTTTSSAVILITLGEPHPPGRCEPAVTESKRRRILAVPSDQIDRTWIGPANVDVKPKTYCNYDREALAE